MSPKTEAVRSRIFEALLRGDYGPGDAVPSEREMMKLTGSSRVTIRRAYSELEAACILHRRHGSGAYISTTPRGNPKGLQLIAVLASLNDMFALEFIDALEKAVVRQEALLVIRQTDQNPRQEAKGAMDLVERGVRNIVVWASGDNYDSRLFARLRILGVNLVFFDRMVPGDFADFVGTDNLHAICTQMDHAWTRGKRDFVLMGYEGVHWSVFTQREDAFLALCRRRKIQPRIIRVPWSDRASHLLHGHSRDVIRVLSEETAAHYIRQKARSWFPTPERLAVLCVNDYLAIQVKQAVPMASVYGVDGLPEAGEQGLVTYRHDMGRMAEEAVKLLFAQQQAGKHWRATHRRFKGRLLTPLT